MDGMAANWKTLWTLGELQEQVQRALSACPEPQANGRVRAIPDARTIRYYTTLGLIDRPADWWGRTALYGRRHLLQLLAIKRLQARGRSLADLQRELLGLTDAELEAVARLPADQETARSAGEERAGPDRRQQAFWKETSAPPEHGEQGQAPALPVQGVPLGDDLMLLLSASRPLRRGDLEALRAAAAPLLEVLQKRRLCRPRPERRAP
jgi:DNA-binding transcriptional MerR regulator